MNYIDPKSPQGHAAGRSALPGHQHAGDHRRDTVPRPSGCARIYHFMATRTSRRIATPRLVRRGRVRAHVAAHLAVRLPRGAHPEVGDYYVYDVGPYSLIVTRVGEDDIRRLLQFLPPSAAPSCATAHEGFATEFKCPFHAGAGTSTAPARQCCATGDFPHRKRKTCRCRRRKWRRLAFRLRQHGPRLAEPRGVHRPRGACPFQGVEPRRPLCLLPRQEAHPGELEAVPGSFHESLHVLATHPQVSPRTATPIRSTILRRTREPLHLDARRRQPHLYGKVHRAGRVRAVRDPAIQRARKVRTQAG